MMQKRKCIKVRLVTQPYIRGPRVIFDQQSRNSTIYCVKMELTTIVHWIPEPM